MKKKIIFGAGNYGKKAIEYYGIDEVAFFVDNDKKKHGRKYVGKEILSYEDFLTVKDNYELIIANSHYEAIAEQLAKSEINKFTCYIPGCEQFIDEISALSEREEIILYGIDYGYEFVVESLKKLGLEKNIKGVVRSGYEKINVDVKYREYESIESVEADYYIVSSIYNHVALAAEVCIKWPNKNVIDIYRHRAYYDTEEIVINPYELSVGETTEEEWNEKSVCDDTKDAIRNYVEIVKNKTPLFKYIEIETINRCNGTCSFCPVNRNADPRVEHMMEDTLFYKIIDELADIDYSGELSLFSNNEPLLDDRIVEFHKYTRAKLPNARIHMFTNGTLMTIEIFKELIECLDELIIDNYMQKLQLIKPVKSIVDYIEEHPELRRKVTVVLRKQEEILTSRGGAAPNRKKVLNYDNEKCALPFEQMIIRPTGEVSLCCNDPLGKSTLGDVSKDSLTDVWYGEEYANVRKKLAQGRGQMEQCKYCDTFYIY